MNAFRGSAYARRHDQRQVLSERDPLALVTSMISTRFERGSKIMASLLAQVLRHMQEVVAKRAGLNPVYEGTTTRVDLIPRDDVKR